MSAEAMLYPYCELYVTTWLQSVTRIGGAARGVNVVTQIDVKLGTYDVVQDGSTLWMLPVESAEAVGAARQEDSAT